MPPRISPSRLQQPTTCQCFRTRPQDVVVSRQSRLLSTSPQHAGRNRKIATKLRRDMWEWLSGPGKAFAQPMQGSTNYLSAYNKSGQLMRMRDAGHREDGEKTDEELSEEQILREEEEEGIDAEEAARRLDRRDAERERKEDLDSRGGVPPERTSDLRPYPLNKDFASQPVLSEELREQIYEQVNMNKHDLETVAGTFGVDIRRVAAVVRLKTIEKQWITEGKRLAKPYSEAVLAMLPKTPFKPNANGFKPHETINDVLVHAKTRQQIFYPTSESRHFTREDAAKVFDGNLLSADKRIPLPSLVKLERWNNDGIDRAERLERMRADDLAQGTAAEKKEKRKREWEERTIKVVPGRRWDFKFQDVSAEKTGKDGKGRHAVGHRYGFPLEDRKRGQFKLPRSVA
nr:37s ribosomal protein s35, mitochondrial [Quercus suber]